jgi:hypothetical protein
MKHYIVYVNGIEVDTIKAGSHNAAEKKAKKKYAPVRAHDGFHQTDMVSVAYTEI